MMNSGRTGGGGEGWTTLPPELLVLTRYMPWRAIRRASGGIGKCPLQLRGRSLYPVQASTPAAWLPLADAQHWVDTGQADGVGLCLPPGMIGLDLDGVFAGNDLEEWAAELVPTRSQKNLRAGRGCTFSGTTRLNGSLAD